MGALDYVNRSLIVHRHNRAQHDLGALLQKLDGRDGPRRDIQAKPVMIVFDNGPIHIGTATIAALAIRAHWLTVEWRPRYARELNDVERLWRDLKARRLTHQTFADPSALDGTIHAAVAALDVERPRQLLAGRRIPAWPNGIGPG